MCCIFTCCGWMIDLIQRFWTFLMSCCISTAVCCVLLTAALSGIALGYNYSLSEYIDLKETNVSVYLKRGIFDDDMVEGMSWRRSGGNSRPKSVDDSKVMTAEPQNEEMPLRSGRRLDDSVIDTDSQHKFEGSLMKLTAKPIDYSSETTIEDPQMSEAMKNYPVGSLDQIKAIHSIFNKKLSTSDSTAPVEQKLTDVPERRNMPPNDDKDRYPSPLPAPANYFPFPYPGGSNVMPYDRSAYMSPIKVPLVVDPYSGRRIMAYEPPNLYMNPARLAVPDKNIGSKENWLYPMLPKILFTRNFYDADGYVGIPTFPKPIPINIGRVRPETDATEPTYTDAEVHSTLESPKSDEEIENLRKNIISNKMDFQRYDDDIMPQKEIKSQDEDYEVESGGAPVRRKRHSGGVSAFPNTRNRTYNFEDTTVKNTENVTERHQQISTLGISYEVESGGVLVQKKKHADAINALADTINETNNFISNAIKN